MAFTQEQYIPFQFIDAARVMFFGRSTEIFHQTYEAWLLASGKEWTEIFQNPKYAIPIKNFEVEFKKPCYAGKPYIASLKVSAINNSSFETTFQLLENDKACFVTKATHVFIDVNAMRPIAIPDDWKAYFAKYLE